MAASSPMPSRTLVLECRNSASSPAIAENSERGRARAVMTERATVHQSADRCALHRNGDDEHGPLGRVVDDAYRAVVAIHEAAHDGQAKAGAARFACGARVDLIEGVEHATPLELGDANPGVGDPKFDGGPTSAQNHHAARILRTRSVDGRHAC